jgi:hypothetical protein
MPLDLAPLTTLFALHTATELFLLFMSKLDISSVDKTESFVLNSNASFITLIKAQVSYFGMIFK